MNLIYRFNRDLEEIGELLFDLKPWRTDRIILSAQPSNDH